MKFLKKIYDLNLINEADEAPPPPGAEADASVEDPAAAPTEEPTEEVVTELSPESEVMYVRLLKKAMVMNIEPEDIDNITNIGDVNETNAKELLGQILQIMKSYSNDIDIEV
jgi:hypothetical protein